MLARLGSSRDLQDVSYTAMPMHLFHCLIISEHKLLWQKFAVTGPALTQRLCSSCSCSSQAKAFSCSRMGILQAIPLLANPKIPCCNLSFVNFPPLAQRTIHRVFCLCTCRFSTLLFRKNNSTIIFLLVTVSRLPQDVFIYVLGGPSWHA